MGQKELLIYLVKLFDRFRLPYLLTGGFAASFYGKPRSTNDIDFVIEVVEKHRLKVEQLIDSLGPEFIYDKESILKLKNEITEFNLFYDLTAIKIDFWVRGEEEFREKYRRRHQTKVDNLPVQLTSPEDLILTKLRWCKEVFSERHFQDCIGIWQVQGEKLDKKFLNSEAKRLGLIQLLNEVKSFPSSED